MFGEFATAKAIQLPTVSYVIAQDIAKSVDYTTTVIHQIRPETIISASNNESSRIYTFEDEVFRDKVQLRYTELPQYTKELMSSLELSGRSALLIDMTGIGAAIYDMYDSFGLDPLGIVFSSGNASNVHTNRNSSRSRFANVSHISVPKSDLIAALKLSVEQGRLRIAKGLRYAEEAENQFRHFVGKFNVDTKKVKMENDSPEIHDDFVVTEAMCAWYVQHMKGLYKERAVKPRPQITSYKKNPFNDKEWT